MNTNNEQAASLKEKRTAAEEFAAEHLVECAAEIIEWQDTAILRNGRVRELAALCEAYSSEHDALRIAESLIARQSMEQAARTPAAPDAEAVAWIRRHPDGTLTGELLLDALIETSRKSSGCWLPLYTAAPPAAAVVPDWRAIVQEVRDRYPTDIFPADGTSQDCASARFARRICDNIAEAFEQAIEEAAPSAASSDEGPKLCDYGNQDDFDEARDEWERQQRYAQIGAMEYNGNTVSYMYSKAKNYGNVLVECCNLIGGDGHILDRIKSLIADRAALAAKASSDEPYGYLIDMGGELGERFVTANALAPEHGMRAQKVTALFTEGNASSGERKGDGLPGWERGVATVTLSGHQLREALDFLNPDGDDDPDQRDEELTFGIVQHKDDDGKVSTEMCCWNDDTDGVFPLHDAPAAPSDGAQDVCHKTVCDDRCSYPSCMGPEDGTQPTTKKD